MCKYAKDLFLAGEDGAEMIEYAIVLACVAGIAGVLFTLRDKLVGVITNTTGQIDGVLGGGAAAGAGG